ncbi:MAG: hypothetical protein EBR74_07445 [Flavobacteriia bacterium]|nr:hypothetical protein [Flavobacteriia bacterium]
MIRILSRPSPYPSPSPFPSPPVPFPFPNKLPFPPLSPPPVPPSPKGLFALCGELEGLLALLPVVWFDFPL